MKSYQIALAAGVSALAVAATANATNLKLLKEGTGWHYGESHAANSNNMFNYDAGGDGQFTLEAVVTEGLDDLSFVDGFIKGDVYKITITPMGGSSVIAKTQFLDSTYYDPIANLNAGPYGTTFGPDWLDGGYGHLQVQLTNGLYQITVKDLCGQKGNPACPGFPAGWGIRLDAVATPEPATWGLMLLGFAGIGAALRGRRQTAAA